MAVCALCYACGKDLLIILVGAPPRCSDTYLYGLRLSYYSSISLNGCSLMTLPLLLHVHLMRLELTYFLVPV